jgi:hypothetical protein
MLELYFAPLSLLIQFDKRIEPSRKPNTRLRKLQRHNGDHRRVVRGGEFLVANGVRAVRHDSGTNIRVCVLGPNHSSVDYVFSLDLLGPCRTLRLELSFLNLCSEVYRQRLGMGLGEVTVSLLGDRSVPDGVQIRGLAVEGNVDRVSADIKVLHVERLVDVTDEVDDELQRFLLLGKAEGLLEGTGRVIGEGGDDASLLGAVALVIYVAGFGRVVD